MPAGIFSTACYEHGSSKKSSKFETLEKTRKIYSWDDVEHRSAQEKLREYI